MQVVGAKTAWQLWAETLATTNHQGEELRKLGAFTIRDLADKNHWTKSKAKSQIKIAGLEYRKAYDHRLPKCGQVRFYFPPGVKAPDPAQNAPEGP